MASCISVSQSTGMYQQPAECRAPRWLQKNKEIRRNKYPTGNIMNYQRKVDLGQKRPFFPSSPKMHCVLRRYSSLLRNDKFMASLNLAHSTSAFISCLPVAGELILMGTAGHFKHWCMGIQRSTHLPELISPAVACSLSHFLQPSFPSSLQLPQSTDWSTWHFL